MNIIIAEDTEDARIILRTNLNAAGYDVRDAPNGAEALKMAKEDPPDMIISDILMPEMDGFALCRAVKNDKKLNKIPFVFYTATYTDAKDEKLAMSLGASCFILKPLENEEFLRTIKEVIDKSSKDTLRVPRMPFEDNEVLDKMHGDSVDRKLEKKIKMLENEIAERKNAEAKLQRTINAFVGRELKMKELKKEIEILKKENEILKKRNKS